MWFTKTAKKSKKTEEETKLERRLTDIEKQIQQLNCEHKNIKFVKYWKWGYGGYLYYYKICSDCDKILKKYDHSEDCDVEKAEYDLSVAKENYNNAKKIYQTYRKPKTTK